MIDARLDNVFVVVAGQGVAMKMSHTDWKWKWAASLVYTLSFWEGESSQCICCENLDITSRAGQAGGGSFQEKKL